VLCVVRVVCCEVEVCSVVSVVCCECCEVEVWSVVCCEVEVWSIVCCEVEVCSVVSVVCCQVEISATDLSFVRRSLTECGVSECDLETSVHWGCCAIDIILQFVRLSAGCLSVSATSPSPPVSHVCYFTLALVRKQP